MRYAILSDIHGNGDALDAVLEELEKENVDKYVCLGDVVGYGAEPQRCIEVIREKSEATVAGNHDFATIEKTNIEFFNAYAKEATYWTRRNLSDDDKEFLVNLPLVVDVDEFTIVHGTLYSPALFDYIQTTFDAYLSLQVLKKQICFLGHSHVPITFFMSDAITYSMEPKIELQDGTKVLVNVGSVGQPRDDNPKAAYAVYDSEENTIEVKRVLYDVDEAARKIREAGLPEVLGERLKYGK
ncbi:MAG: metallophosphoesterase [Planctomycetota bacterium]|nr:MAG: metallophosphoesterase [Planctomycetota bacterium]